MKNEVVGAKNWNIMISLEKLEKRWGKLEKLELEILEMFPYRTLENKAGSSPAFYSCVARYKCTSFDHFTFY